MEFCNTLGTRLLQNSRELHPAILARNEMLASEANLCCDLLSNLSAEAERATKFGNCCSVLTASPSSGLSSLDHWPRPQPAGMHHFFAGAKT
jgi:hypothetical protein